MSRRIFIMAGEASGDVLGGLVLSALKADGADYEISGVGGPNMQGQGLASVLSMDEFNVIGLSQAMAAYSRLKRCAQTLIDHVMATRPELVVMVDNKGFSLRFGKALKKAMAAAGWSAPIVQIVAPTVWVWGGWRAKAVPKSVDSLLCLFPFEPPYFTRYGVEAVAVGHPFARVNPLDQATARKMLGLKDGPVLALLPGSRKREVITLLPQMLEAAGKLVRQDPSLQVILPVASSVEHLIAPMIAELPFVQLFRQQLSPTVMAAGDFGLICSGTATLEAALSGLPGHVYYKTDPITTFFGQFLVNKKNIVLANAVAGQKIYPLSLNRKVTAANMVAAVSIFFSLGAPRLAMKDKLARALSISDGAAPREMDFGANVAAELRRLMNGAD